MSNILCLETATTNCSVALARNGGIVAFREENNLKFSHSEKLHVFIEEVLREAQIDKNDLDAIAISKGPGSYTGLRIGVSAAKGLCFALDVPLLSISTLALLAHQVEEEDVYIIAMLDARRMEVYSAVFDSDYELVRDIKAEILDENSFSEYLKLKKTIFLGDGAKKFQQLCPNGKGIFLEERFPSATDMAALAEMKFQNQQFEDVAYFEPYYLKEFMLG